MNSPANSLPPPAIPADVLRVLTARPEPITDAERAALDRLIRCAQSATGQSRRCANFLLSWWNAGRDGGFDMTDLWAVDTSLANDMVAVFGLIAREHNYPAAYVDRDVFVGLVAKWRPGAKK